MNNEKFEIINFKENLRKLKETKKNQAESLKSDYMIGMYNGIELCLSTIENRDKPEFRNCEFKFTLSQMKYWLESEDDDLLLGWHSNISCFFMDNCNIDHEKSNELAREFLNRFFDLEYDWKSLVYRGKNND